MGALVSPGGGDWEKSIEVPCIILSTSSLLFHSCPPISFRSCSSRRERPDKFEGQISGPLPSPISTSSTPHLLASHNPQDSS